MHPSHLNYGPLSQIQKMRDNMKKLEDDLTKCISQRDYYHSFFERCCGRNNLPLNLEMINNNHAADQDFKSRSVTEIEFKIQPPTTVSTCLLFCPPSI